MSQRDHAGREDAVVEDKELIEKIDELREMLVQEVKTSSPESVIAKYTAESDEFDDGQRELALILLAQVMTLAGEDEAANACAATVMDGDFENALLHRATGFLVIAQATKRAADIELYRTQIPLLKCPAEQAAALLDYMELAVEEDAIREAQDGVRRLSEELAANEDYSAAVSLYARLGAISGEAEDFAEACANAELIPPTDDEDAQHQAFEMIFEAMYNTLKQETILSVIAGLVNVKRRAWMLSAFRRAVKQPSPYSN